MKACLSADDASVTTRPCLSPPRGGDKWIPWYFVAFFVVVALLDGIFVTLAIRSHTGVVTDRAYEKGLAYDEILSQAAEQKKMGVNDEAEFREGRIFWTLRAGAPIENATVTAKFFRPPQDGHDFEITLTAKGGGRYEAEPQFPLPGAWKVRLEAQWRDSRSQIMRYRTSLNLVAP